MTKYRRLNNKMSSLVIILHVGRWIYVCHVTVNKTTLLYCHVKVIAHITAMIRYIQISHLFFATFFYCTKFIFLDPSLNVDLIRGKDSIKLKMTWHIGSHKNWYITANNKISMAQLLLLHFTSFSSSYSSYAFAFSFENN